QPVNKFPDFVRIVVQRLKTLAPTMGKVKIAQTLARAGLHLGATTVGRMLKGGENTAVTLAPAFDPSPPAGESSDPESGAAVTAGAEGGKQRVVTAKYPNHLWHADLTLVPT